MEYKGETLSDNLTQSQIDMYKWYIDQGNTMQDILKKYQEPENEIDNDRLPEVHRRIK
jgi:hypothetical protein